MPVTVRNTDILFNDGTTQSTAAGVPTFDGIGSVSQLWFSGTSNTTAGSNVSGANLFRITAAVGADTAVNQQGMSNLDLNQFPGANGDFRGRTTALSANSRTVSPVSGTWRLQTYALRSYFDGCLVTRYYSVLAIRVA